MPCTISQTLLFSHQLLDLAWGCFRHVETNNENNKDEFLIKKYVYYKLQIVNKINISFHLN